MSDGVLPPEWVTRILIGAIVLTAGVVVSIVGYLWVRSQTNTDDHLKEQDLRARASETKIDSKLERIDAKQDAVISIVGKHGETLVEHAVRIANLEATQAVQNKHIDDHSKYLASYGGFRKRTLPGDPEGEP